MVTVTCPVCGLKTTEGIVNDHLDRGCPSTKGGGFSSSQTVPRSPSVQELRTDKKHSLSQSSDIGPEQDVERSDLRDKRQRAMVSTKPLAEQVRPSSLEEFVGQSDLVGPRGILKSFIDRDACPSMILWGPSGVGKTTLARIIAQTTKSRFVELSAAVHSTGDVKKVFEEAKNELKLLGRKTILFMDEIHRFNKAQQDAFLPYVERGDITLIGATTENPSFKVNGALISRSRVFVLQKLSQGELEDMLKLAVKKVNNNRTADSLESFDVGDALLSYIAGLADGDGRVAINILEISLNASEGLELDVAHLKSTLSRTHMLYDRNGDAHYDTISALHKSIRGSDPDAALFYLGRMLEAGEDPLFIARRMVRMASEDIGLRDDTCLPFATAVYTAVQQIGMPEADCILAHCAVKLARAPKSVQVYRAYNAVKDLLRTEPGAAAAVVPVHLRNAPTRLMKELGYGKEYKYNPDYIDGKVVQQYMPDGMEQIKFLGKRHLGVEYDADLEFPADEKDKSKVDSGPKSDAQSD